MYIYIYIYAYAYVYILYIYIVCIQRAAFPLGVLAPPGSTTRNAHPVRTSLEDRKVDIRLHDKGNSKLPWRKAGQPSHLVDVVNSD